MVPRTMYKINEFVSKKYNNNNQDFRLPYLANSMNVATSSKGVELSVSPLSCLHDEPVSVRVEGLFPDQNITLMSSVRDVRGVNFLSHAHYRATKNGIVDVNTMESLGGNYKGLFPMGLIGSLLPAPNEYKYTRYFKKDVENPALITISVYNDHLSSEELCSPDVAKPLMSIMHERHYMAPGVQRIPVRYKKVRGSLFLPPGEGPFPGVVDMFGTAGGLLEYRSAQLASRGFASLALAFFNYDDLPKGLEEFNIAYFEEAVEFLLKHDKIIKKGVGVIGTSKGGDLAVAMATFIPSVVACITINGFFGPVNQGLQVGSHFYPPIMWDIKNVHFSDEGIFTIRQCSPSRKELEELRFPIEKSRAAFLFLAGVDDTDVNSVFQAQIACEYLKSRDYKYSYKVISYPGTGHLLEPPYSPHCRASFQHTFMAAINWGGHAIYHTKGQEKAWKDVQTFLFHHLIETAQDQCDVYSDACYLRSRL